MNRNSEICSCYRNTDNFKYFKKGFEFNQVGGELFPFGYLWRADDLLLDAMLKYYYQLKAYALALLNKDEAWKSKEEHWEILVDPSYEKDYVESRYNGKFICNVPYKGRLFSFSTLDDIFSANVDLTRRSIISNFRTDVLILAKNKSEELFEDEYAFLLYDINSQSSFGRFVTDDHEDTVTKNFISFCGSLPYALDNPQALREIPLSFFDKSIVQWDSLF